MPKQYTPTPQESLVSLFIRRSISGYAAFHPKLFGNGHEPADMVILIGRAMFLINMHQSVSNFNSMDKHNLDQARDRIEEWKGGKPICGNNDQNQFKINYKDIDSIHVISVIDGQNAACCGHMPSALSMDPKVCLITTLTLSVIRRFAELAGSARDLIAVSKNIQRLGKIDEQAAIKLVEVSHDDIFQKAFAHVTRLPDRLSSAKVHGINENAIVEHRSYIEMCRAIASPGSNAFVDLAWRDVAAITAHIVHTQADIEWRPEGNVVVAQIGEEATYTIVVSTNGELLDKILSDIACDATNRGDRFVQLVCLTPIGPQTIFALPKIVQASMTEIELKACAATV